MYSSSQLIPPLDLFNSEYDPRLPHAARASSRESFPGVIKPLDLTVVAMSFEQGMRCPLRDLGVTSIDPPALLGNRVHQGRVYANLSWAMWMADMLPGADASDVEQEQFGQRIEVRIARPEISKAEKSAAKRHKLHFYANLTNAILGAKKRFEKHLALRHNLALANSTNSELDALIVPWQDELIKACEWDTRSTLAGQVIITALRRALGVNQEHSLVALLSDLGEMESAAPVQKIRDIAQIAKRRNPTLARALKSSYQRWETLHEIDANAHDALRAVVDRYGYRSLAQFLISAPSWAEDPTPVMDAFVGKLLASGKDKTHPNTQTEAARSAIMAAGGTLKRAHINTLVKLAQRCARARERANACLVVRVDMLRQLFREIARRLLQAGRIDEVGELYFLSLEEVRNALTGDISTDLRKQAALRRTEVETLEARGEPEELICGHEPVALSSPEMNAEVRVLHGLGVSGSAVEGVARVVNSSDELDIFKAGEILVASHIDAGWTPYFTLAAAVIVETGGLLAHTSVVARELGLAAMVHVQGATRVIRNGDRLRLDPASGEVHILVCTEGESIAVL